MRLIRKWLQKINYHVQPLPERVPDGANTARLAGAEAALLEMPMPDNASREYLLKHLSRLAQTLALVPPPGEKSRVLELGCYMQLTPLLNRFSGYKEVRGAYFGSLGKTDCKTVQLNDGPFSCAIDHFDAERDRFPYPDEHFDLVIAGEIIEHMIYDPMHLLVESRRVLREGGSLLLSTPNIGSITSVAKALDGRDNPQIYFLYKKPARGEQPDIGHMREYTAYEIGQAVEAAGFEVTRLFTTHIAEFASHLPLLQFLAENGYSTENRGEQTWCLASKRSELPITRYPFFVYE